MGIHPLSLVTTPLLMRFDDQNLATGTGFFYKADEQVYLITNWHNVSGRDPETKQCLSSTQAVPNNFRLCLHQKTEVAGSISKSLYKAIEYPLIVEDEPTFVEHRLKEKIVDIVAIPLSLPDDVYFNCINNYNFDPYIPTISDDVFIIGYPWGLKGGTNVLPIWKRGTIASEPLIDYNGMPQMLVDSSAISGMSGSPVICSHSGFFDSNSEPGKVSGDAIIGTVSCFLGIYSGRLKSFDKKEISDLGIVWTKNLIEEILKVVIKHSPLDPVNTLNPG